MPLQILTLKLDGITAGDYLTWCRDPDPPALDFALQSISIDADPVGDTITATLDWSHHVPAAPAAAGSAGLPLSPGVHLQSPAISEPDASSLSTNDCRHSRHRARRRARDGVPGVPSPDMLVALDCGAC
jgi:hypothetical protein